MTRHPKIPFSSSHRCLLVFGIAFALGSSGCMTSGEGNKLKKDVAVLQAQLAASQLQAEKGRKKLKKVLEQATGMLNRNNADVGAQVERLESNLRKISGTTEANSKTVTDLSKSFSEFRAKVDVKLERLAIGAPKKKQAPVPEDKEKLFAAAQFQGSHGKYAEARRLLRHFISRFPGDPRVPNAYLMLGDTYYREGKFAKAIQEYRTIFERHKKAKVYPTVLYKIGMSFYQLKFCTDARGFLGELQRRYRRHKNAKSAKKVLKLIRRYRKNRRFCTS
ncbi:MAG: outer membrane protein assembly factor BamD [Deltaproteobacteria bacterium]|nr:outer membrane protein assembly factor BamD [Deltaproteobacteria bacterium]